MKDEVVCEVLEETITKTHCPQCQNSLKSRWLTQVEQEELNFWDLEPGFRNGSQLSQVEVYFCPRCGWEKPSLLVKAEYENIPTSEEKQKYQKERDFVEKVTTILLPNQSVKIRFVKSIISEGKEKMARTLLFKIPELENREVVSICFSIEFLVKREKANPGSLCDVLAHELAHVSPEVFKNPHHNPDQKVFPNCSCRKTDIFFNPHSGKGHDKIWHDKYDEFRERIKNENLAKGSGYRALGMDFEYGKDESDKEEKTSSQLQLKREQPRVNSKIYLIGSLVLASLAGLIVWLTFRKKK